MYTLFTFIKLIYTWGIRIAVFCIFVLVEWYVIYETIPMLINDYGMDPIWAKYIWGFAAILVTYQLFIIVLRGLVQGIKNFFTDIWN